MIDEKNNKIFASLHEKLPQSVGTRFVIEVLPNKYGMKYDPCFEVVSIVDVINKTLDIELDVYCIKFNSEPSCRKGIQKRFTIEGENRIYNPAYTSYINFSSREHGVDFTWRHENSSMSKTIFKDGIGYTNFDFLYQGAFRIGDLLADDPCKTLPDVIELKSIRLK